MTTAIYARSAHPGPNELERQEAECEALAGRLGHVGTRRYRDTGLGRDGFRTLLRDAEAGCITTMIITRPDKIARDFSDFVERMRQLEAVGVQTYTVQDGQPLTDWRSSSMLVAVAQFDEELQSEQGLLHG